MKLERVKMKKYKFECTNKVGKWLLKLEIFQLTWKEPLKLQKPIEFEKSILVCFDHFMDSTLEFPTSVNFPSSFKLSNFSQNILTLQLRKKFSFYFATETESFLLLVFPTTRIEQFSQSIPEIKCGFFVHIWGLMIFPVF